MPNTPTITTPAHVKLTEAAPDTLLATLTVVGDVDGDEDGAGDVGGGANVGDLVVDLPGHVNDANGTQLVPLHTLPAAHAIPSGQMVFGDAQLQHDDPGAFAFV